MMLLDDRIFLGLMARVVNALRLRNTASGRGILMRNMLDEERVRNRCLDKSSTLWPCTYIH